MSVLNLGCIMQDWRVPVGGDRVPVVLGYADPKDYVHNPFFLGAIEGRVANRIRGASFDLGGHRYHLDANTPPHTLHGGSGGIGRRIWDMDALGQRTVRLSLHSPDGDQGFPGAVDFEVMISLNGYSVTYDLRARPDRPTPINLAQHSYYNLLGQGDVFGHQLSINADQITETDDDLIPTGRCLPIQRGHFDFREERMLSDADPSRSGYDDNFVLRAQREEAATLKASNGLCLKLWTDQPGLQFYSGTKLAPGAAAHSGQSHRPFGGLCLEAQGFPDSPNRPEFPSIIVSPDIPYHQKLVVEIKPEGMR